MELNYPILSDPDKAVARAYGVVTEKRPVPFRWTFFIDKGGNVRAIDTEVKPASHGADIAKRLKELKIAD